MNRDYFSDRELGPTPRVNEDIGREAWGGIVSIINNLIQYGSFGLAFPDTCQDSGAMIIGTNETSMALSIRAEIPKLVQHERKSDSGFGDDDKEIEYTIINDYWPLKASKKPSTMTILDLLEFCYRHVAKVNRRDLHSYSRHHHLTFDKEDGQIEFGQNINRVFSRNGLAFELKPDGHIERLGPPVLRESLTNAIFVTGDLILDKMLADSRSKFFSPQPDIRREALEKLWDAWERIKTIEDPTNKKKSINTLLDKASPEPKFREQIGKEATELTNIGNDFLIRHSEICKPPLETLEQVDYLFHRLFAMIFMLLARK
jgi:hypothetical protein